MGNEAEEASVNEIIKILAEIINEIMTNKDYEETNEDE
jgi:hypothetical protein